VRQRTTHAGFKKYSFQAVPACSSGVHNAGEMAENAGTGNEHVDFYSEFLDIIRTINDAP
jgi:hypothetical protein